MSDTGNRPDDQPGNGAGEQAPAKPDAPGPEQSKSEGIPPPPPRGSRWQAIRKSLRESWTYVRDEVSRRWEALSEEDIEEVEGELHKLVDKIAERYGIARHEAEKQVGDWVKKDAPWMAKVRTVPSFRWTVIFFVAALAFGFVGFTPITDFVQWLSRVLFYLSALGFIAFLMINLGMGDDKKKGD